jgi:amidase
MSDELARLDAIAQAELVSRGEVAQHQLVDAAIERIDRVNSELNAVITPLFERASERAHGEGLGGPFRGVPVLMKDLDVCTAGDPFHCGMKHLKDLGYTADHDGYFYKKLCDSGFISLGKTNTPELGLMITTEPVAYGPSRNPWNTDHSTGGSSGGSAAAVAAGLVPVAHASDGGGSIRIPASECGLVGLKPSRGRISLGPDYGEYWNGAVTSHVVSRTVRDSAAVLDELAGPMPGDPYTAPAPRRAFAEEVGAPVEPLRIGLMRAIPAGGSGRLHHECVTAVENVGRALEAEGHHVEIAHPEPLNHTDELTANFQTVVASWVASSLDEWSRVTGVDVGSSGVEVGTWLLAELGRNISAAEYVTTVKWISAYTRRMAAWWHSGYDLLITPTIAEPPPELGYFTPGEGDDTGEVLMRTLRMITFTMPFNLTAQPAISLPLHWTPEGLPVGVQLVAGMWDEGLLLRVAAELEQLMPWADKVPPVHA